MNLTTSCVLSQRRAKGHPKEKLLCAEVVVVWGWGAVGTEGQRRLLWCGEEEEQKCGIFWADVGADPALPPVQAPAPPGGVPAGVPLQEGHSRATHSARGKYRKHLRQGHQASPLILSKELVTKYSCKGIRIIDALK